MSKTRLEAFSDGVIAILITIMVLEFKAPRGVDLDALRPMLPTFLVYALSFVFLGIYWNNHHHLLHAATRISGAVMWANLHLLFWLSLVPFVTAWMGENHYAPVPTSVYGVVLFMSGMAFTILLRTLLAVEGPQSKLAAAVGRDVKGNVSLVLYAIAIPMAFVHQTISDVIYLTVACIWLVPDPRIETRL
jgi:uncharacterized membrane protein